ncbi:MAG: Gfo/Idh/MocA family oxidoreductase [Gemmatimonadaceae bacterium]|jgi:predicted dehydrogenase|nr:Gfo/Idh/MocA family oxidoreductase [Gemmatimonadaceae bacterium]
MTSSEQQADIGVGIIGCGYWGPNLIRNFNRHPRCRVERVADLKRERAEAIAREFHVPAANDQPSSVIDDPRVRLVVIATPAASHYQLARRALLAGKHVLVMKPFTTSTEHAEELIALAARQGLVCAVDHTFVYTGAVRKMYDTLHDGSMGDLFYIDSVRINLGLFQSDVNVLWDLAPHDLSIIDYLLDGQQPTGIHCLGAAHAGGSQENIAYLTVSYPGNVLAHVHVNWLAPAKVRRTIVGGSRRMVVYDDGEPSEKVRIYDRGVSIQQAATTAEAYAQFVSYRQGDIIVPQLDNREALAVEVDHLVDCIHNGKTPRADGAAGLRVVHILEQAQRQLEAARQDAALARPRALAGAA